MIRFIMTIIMEILIGKTSVAIDTKESRIASLIKMEIMGIEPTSLILEITILPLNYIPIFVLYNIFLLFSIKKILSYQSTLNPLYLLIFIAILLFLDFSVSSMPSINHYLIIIHLYTSLFMICK